MAISLAAATLLYWQATSSHPSDNLGLELKPMPLTSYTGTERSPALSPDGKQVALSWDGEKQDNPDIYVKLLDTGNPVRLTTDPGTDDMPVWSPNGRRVTFVRTEAGFHPFRFLFVCNECIGVFLGPAQGAGSGETIIRA